MYLLRRRQGRSSLCQAGKSGILVLIFIFLTIICVFGGPSDRIIIMVLGRLLIDDRQGGGVTAEDGLTKIELSPYALGRDYYIIINLDPLNTPKEVDVNKIREANSLDDLDPFWDRINGSMREFNAYGASGERLRDAFKGRVVITIPYPDYDGDGFVDGVHIDENSLRVYTLVDKGWVDIEKEGGRQLGIDKVKNLVFAQIPYFSTYILFGRPGPSPNLKEVAVYPNPFKPNNKGHRVIRFGHPTKGKLTSPASIRIYNIAGELVRTIREPEDDGISDGMVEWLADNESGEILSSGVYIYIIENPKGERVIGKIGIIR